MPSLLTNLSRYKKPLKKYKSFSDTWRNVQDKHHNPTHNQLVCMTLQVIPSFKEYVEQQAV